MRHLYKFPYTVPVMEDCPVAHSELMGMLGNGTLSVGLDVESLGGKETGEVLLR